jgi:vacuolar-type H+-ATPase subunit I/STV1
VTQPPAEPAQPIQEAAPVERETPPPPPRDRQPAAPAAVQQAIEEVNQIIETLRGTLDDMEQVLETLELAERQKIADEHEIETLRRGLHQLHRPRESGYHPPRH